MGTVGSGAGYCIEFFFVRFFNWQSAVVEWLRPIDYGAESLQTIESPSPAYPSET